MPKNKSVLSEGYTKTSYVTLYKAWHRLVRNVLICREAPVTYREDVALEDAWHEEVGTVYLNHTMVSRHGSMVFEEVAVVIRQYALKNCLWQMVLGANVK